jgi:DNA replication protein DnaC
MSDNSIYQEARSHLAYLRMAAAAEALPAELEYATTQKLGHTAFLKRLLEVEVSATEIRRRASLERFASLPSPFRLEDFDFDAQPSIDKKLVNEPGHPALPRGRHQRVVHRTTRCGQDHVGGGSRPGFHRYGLSDVLHNGRRPGGPLSPGRSRRTVGHHHVLFAGPRLLVIDEVSYLPLANEAAAALFQVMTQRYLKSSTVLTTNLGVGSWGKIFDDPMVAAAMLDRLLHRSVVFNIDGESYRMRTHRARAEKLVKGVKPTIKT